MADELRCDLPTSHTTPRLSSALISTTMDSVSKQLITVSPFPSTILKLESGNYLIWKSQVLPLLSGHKLDRFMLKEHTLFMDEINAIETKIDDEILEGFKLLVQCKSFKNLILNLSF